MNELRLPIITSETIAAMDTQGNPPLKTFMTQWYSEINKAITQWEKEFMCDQNLLGSVPLPLGMAFS